MIIYWLTSQEAQYLELGLAEAETAIWISRTGTGGQAREPSSAAFPGALAESSQKWDSQD